MKVIESLDKGLELSEKTKILIDAIRMRRSIREFTDEKIPDEHIELILDAARYAPSPENMQMWRYVVIREDFELKKWLSDLCQKAAAELFGSAPYELTQARLWYIHPKHRPSVFEPMRNGTLFRYPEKADIAIIGLTSESFHDSPFRYPIDILGSICVGMGVLQMWLVASSLGYGMGYQALPIMEPRRRQLLCDKLGIPRLWEPVSTVFIGVPKERRVLGPSRFPLEGVMYKERWGIPYQRIAFKEER
ncbi:MAG: nitroreductase family protein [Candidatus Methanofastidiosia archaeon]